MDTVESQADIEVVLSTMTDSIGDEDNVSNQDDMDDASTSSTSEW